MKKISPSIKTTEMNAISEVAVRLYKSDEKLQKDKFMKPQMETIEVGSRNLTTAINRDRVKSQLKEFDSKRDEAIKHFRKLVEGYRSLPDKTKSDGAKFLMTIYDKYRKNIISKSYAIQSTLTDSLIEDLEAEDAKVAIQNLDSVAELVEEIKKTQQDFIVAQDKYTKYMSEKPETASQLKKILLSEFNDKLIPYVNVMVKSGDASFESFANKLEFEINKLK